MKCSITSENITGLKDNEIFVFGSNLASHHGAGAAYTALQWGAVIGKGEGIYGQTYALPTKDNNIQTMSISEIALGVLGLLQDVIKNTDKHFLITKVGCGLAGLKIEQVAPLFRICLDIDNCSLPQEFIDFLTEQP